MKKDPVKTAQEILKAFGGKENVISATHCAIQASRGSKGCIYY